MKPENARIADILNSQMDQTAQNHLLNTWRKNLRDLAPLSRITSAVTPAHSKNASAIWQAAMVACAQQSPSALGAVYTDLKPKIGEIKTAHVANAIDYLLKNQKNEFQFLDQIPIHVLQNLVDQQLEFWALAATPDLLASLVLPLAQRGALPRHNVRALKAALRSSDQLRYIEATTAFLKTSKVCTSVSTRLCLLFIELGPPKPVIEKFVEVLQNCQTSPLKKHPLSSSNVLLELSKLNIWPRDRAFVQSIRADSVPQAYHNLVNSTDDLPPNSATALYANWLRCCARDNPQDLDRFYQSARSSIAQKYGLSGNRERLLLRGLVKGLIQSKNWEMLRSFVPHIMKTQTPYLRNAAITATKSWDLAFQMNAEKIPLNKSSMMVLLQSGDSEALKNLLKLVDVLPSGVLASYLQIINKGNLPKYTDLLRTYRQIFDLIAADLKQKHVSCAFIDEEAIEAVVWGALRTKPKQPWQIVHFLKELLDSRLTTHEQVSKGFSKALQAVQEDNGTAEHIRQHSLPGGQLVKRFNQEWKAIS